jgi:glucokinase
VCDECVYILARMRLLAGDVGGSKTALAVYGLGDDGKFAVRAERTYASTEHSSFAEVLAKFDAGRVDAAAFGVAGPVIDGRSNTTNLPWSLSERELAEVVGAPVKLINDFHAVALGVLALPDSQLHVLQAGPRDPSGPVAVIGAGTGLGEALCVPTEHGPRVVAGEGGHASFAPNTPLELRLLQFLLRRYEHVSVERVVSGIGLPELYEFVVTEGLAPAHPDTLRRCEREPAGAVLAAQAGVDPAAEIALSLFVGAYGAEAGNWALKTLPTGGMFVAGGIAPRLISRLSAGSFIQSFLAKGRLSPVLARIPVAVVVHPNVGLLGARVQAALLCSAGRANGRKGAA